MNDIVHLLCRLPITAKLAAVGTEATQVPAAEVPDGGISRRQEEG